MCLDVSEESEERQRRKRWVRDPPEILLRQLEKAQLTRASSTFIVNRAGQPACQCISCSDSVVACSQSLRVEVRFCLFLLQGGDPLVGPLSQSQGDDTDAPEPDVATDEERLQPRSDDEDT